MVSLKLATTLDPVAMYAAIIATILLVWDIIKFFREGPKIELTVSPNMVLSNETEKKHRVVIAVRNTGSKTTTIENLGMVYWPDQASKTFKKKQKNFIIPDPSIHGVVNSSIPFELEVGKKWQGFIEQNEEIQEMSKGYLFIEIYHSLSRKPERIRLKIKTLTK